MRSRLVFFLCGVGLLAGCNKDDPASVPPPPPPPPPPATYTVGGTVTGLTGSVTLANNGGDARAVTAAGAFTFVTPLATGSAYAVTVTSQPANQTCIVASGSGAMASANITGVTVSCATNTFTVGGSVTGLAGSGLVLQNNGGDNLARAADGAFTFTTPVASGGAYSVTVATQPSAPAQTCAATSNSGTISANVANVTITCTTDPNVVGSAAIGPAGGTVNGVYGAQIIVPPGALPNTVTLGLARDSSHSPAYAVTETDAIGATYELTPHGQAFTLPVTVRIPFDAAQVSNDAVPEIYKAEAGGTFAALPTTVNGNFLEASITGFSWVIPAAQSTRPRMVYTVENASGAMSLNSYRIDRATGALGASTSAAPVGEFPFAAISHQSGKFVFLTNAGSNTANGIAPNSIATYRLNTINGQLAGPATSSVATRGPLGYRPTMPTLHPSGKFLYVINFGSVTNNGGGDIDKFTINAATGALMMSGPAISGAGAQPMGMVFDRLGTRAYVLYAGSMSANILSSQIVLYDVNLATGEFSAPVSSVAAGVLGGNPWSLALDPNNRSLHIACLSTNELLSYGVNASTGALSPLGSSISVLRRPASLAADSFGRFIFATKQDVLVPGNVLSYRMDNATGALSFVNGQFSGCPGGACGGPTAVVADPQGNFAYAIDTSGGLTAFDVNATSGALTSVASRTGAWVPAIGGVGAPFRFAVSGASPVWQHACTINCALNGPVFHSGSGSGGGNPPTNPSPPTTHFLSVSIGPFFGAVSSTPAGIDYAPPSNANPLGRSDFSSGFPANSTVTLCATEPQQPAGAYDITWTGSCSGTGWCTTVTMNSDKSCNAGFSPATGR
jgi:6-phosphogluconolactonase (cycloisomerase 2 family)